MITREDLDRLREMVREELKAVHEWPHETRYRDRLREEGEWWKNTEPADPPTSDTVWLADQRKPL